jgi:hypothetical protein
VHYLEFALPRTQLSSFYFQSRKEKMEVFFLGSLSWSFAGLFTTLGAQASSGRSAEGAS